MKKEAYQIAISVALVLVVAAGVILLALRGVHIDINYNYMTQAPAAAAATTAQPAVPAAVTSALPTPEKPESPPAAEATAAKPQEPATASAEEKTTVPAQATDALTVFNQASKKAAFRSATYSATMTDIVFSSSLIERFFDKNEAMSTCAIQDAAAPGKFTQIKAGDISSSEITEDGETLKVTLKLKSAGLPIDAEPPQNGYPFFMDASSVQTQVAKVNDKLEYKNDGSISLSDGVLTALIDKSTGNIVSATLTLKENCSDGISMGSIGNLLGLSQLTGEFHYDITVQYK